MRNHGRRLAIRSTILPRKRMIHMIDPSTQAIGPKINKAKRFLCQLDLGLGKSRLLAHIVMAPKHIQDINNRTEYV